MSTNCLFCESENQSLVLPLGQQPLANSYVRPERLEATEPVYPLDLYVCQDCGMCHIEVVATSEDIFSDYAYFSSFSTTWLEHAAHYVEKITARLGLGADSHVVEIASNDGYLLQFMKERGIPCMGVEPAANVAEAAVVKGIPTEVAFWGVEAAARLKAAGKSADLMIANNVLAHVPTLNDFVAGFKVLLKADGVATFEFPHLMELVKHRQFDTIYHEHFSYYALFTLEKLFAHHGMTVFDVEQLPTHGGSLRIYVRHAEDEAKGVTDAVRDLVQQELKAGMDTIPYYEAFAASVAGVKTDFLKFLADAKEAGKTVAAYGAPAKGNTMLNYCGVTAESIAFTLDRNPHKQGCYLPGSLIPIYAPEHATAVKPDYLVILPWNLKSEIMEQMAHIRDWGGKFVVAIPELEIIE